MPLHMHRRFGMKGEHIGARVGELLEVLLRSVHHQVHVQWPVREAAKGPDQWSSESQVRDEVPVHYVDVKPLRATGHRSLDLFAQPSQVGAQHTWRDPDSQGTTAGPRLTTKATAAPRGRPTPAAGLVATTTPRSSPAEVVSTVPSRTPAAVRILVARGTLSPITSGTATRAGPALSTS